MVAPNGGVAVGGNFTPSYALRVSGSIAYTGGIYDISDLRLKENIREIDDPLGRVQQLRGVYFEMKDQSLSEGTEVGVILKRTVELSIRIALSVNMPENPSVFTHSYRTAEQLSLQPMGASQFNRFVNNDGIYRDFNPFNCRL